ncbi:hypothetical protein [Cellulomonas hominis]
MNDAVRLADLTAEQLAWVPETPGEAYGQWPAGTKVEMYGPIVFTNDAGDANWDSRSLALAARAYPGWLVKLEPPGVLVDDEL